MSNSTISYKQFLNATKTFSNLQKENIPFSVRVNQIGYSYDVSFTPLFGVIKTLGQCASLCATLNRPLQMEDMSSTFEYCFPYVKDSSRAYNVVQLGDDDNKTTPNLKYFFGVGKKKIFEKERRVLSIDQSPYETTTDGVTYREMVGTGKMLAIGHTQPAYNYLDRGNFVIYHQPDLCISGEDEDADPEEVAKLKSPAKDGCTMFVTNRLTLDVCYMDALIALDPGHCLPLLANGVFLDHANAKLVMLRAEKLLPAKFKDAWLAYKSLILADFQSRAQDLMMTKLVNSEVSAITLQGVALTGDRASYETVNIEAPELSKRVFSVINPNEFFNIFTIIEAYAEITRKEFENRPLNANATGFHSEHNVSFKINDIPITVGVETTNTRRKINGMYVKKDELAKVIRQAGCFTTKDYKNNVEEFNNFVRSVELQSLDVHKVLASGLPIKIFHFTPYESGDATELHPKLFFKKENGKYHLWLDAKHTTSVVLERFVTFVAQARSINRRSDGGWGKSHTEPDGTSNYGHKNAEWCAVKIKALIREHSVGVTEEQIAEITDAQLTKLMADTLVAREQAVKKSEKLLATVVKEVGAEAGNWGPGLGASAEQFPGYTVKGASGVHYFIRTDNLNVFNKDSIPPEYICIVPGKGDPGVGFDGLVARIRALYNDSYLTKEIYTLQKHVESAKQSNRNNIAARPSL